MVVLERSYGSEYLLTSDQTILTRLNHSTYITIVSLAMSSFRDSSILIIETGRTVVRAGLGIQELLKTPTVVRCTRLVADWH